jgi:hypothetical protein
MHVSPPVGMSCMFLHVSQVSGPYTCGLGADRAPLHTGIIS